MDAAMDDFLVHFDRTLRISLPAGRATVRDMKAQLELRAHVPASLVDLYVNGRKLLEDGALVPSLPTLVRARLSGGLRGGKGGFGAMLRSQGKGSGAKATTSFGACRDLNGRRLRHVNQEIAAIKWKEESEIRELQQKQGITDREIMDEETPSGIPGWYLATPSWADSIKKSYMKRRRNTIMCKNWMQARADGRMPPPRAPRWWGCPRGRDCDFAHGEDELRGAGLTDYKRAKKEEVYEKKQQQLQKYLDYELEVQDNINDAVLQGLRNRKKKSPAAAVAAKTAKDAAAILPPDATYLSVQASHADLNDWLVPLGGQMSVTFRHGLCEVRGQGNFGTATMADDCCVTSGKYYYEVKLVTDGVVQLGWADGTFEANSEEGDGVGDHPRSWSYDGSRQQKWTSGQEAAYGEAWQKDDIIGCLLDLDSNTISFSRNGQLMGPAFIDVRCLDIENRKQKGFYPAISVEQTEILLVNIGAQPLLNRPDGYLAVIEAMQGREERTASAVVAAPKPVDRLEISKSVDVPTPSVEAHEEDVKPVTHKEEAPADPVDLDKFESTSDLEKLGLEELKAQLRCRGLKCG